MGTAHQLLVQSAKEGDDSHPKPFNLAVVLIIV